MSELNVAAYRAGGAPVSPEAFYAIACDPRRSVVVEACAGAGKTWMLVSRVLRALLDGAQPQEILAITFTRKAAGEMRDRLGELLQELAEPNCSDEQRAHELIARGLPAAQAAALAPALAQLQERLLDAGRAVEVRTFHAWFSQLLRAAPLELLAGLGLQRDMALVEDVDEHRDAVLRRFHAALLRNPALRTDHAALIALRGRSQVAKWLDAAWSRRIEFELADEAGVLDDSIPSAAACWPELNGMAHPTQNFLSAAWTTTFGELAQALGRGGAHARKAADGLALALQAPDPQLRFDAAWRALFTTTGGPRKLGDVAGLGAAQMALQSLAAQVQQQEAHVEHGRMVRLTRVLLSQWAAYKRARGLADMADLERCALALLRDATLAGWVQERLDARLRHLLIDEFQDTSPLQWHALLAWLSGYAGAGGGASGQRSMSVFIVGDPKQSIYRFRRAEPRVFDAARAFVVDGLAGMHLEADHTRRNAPGVLAAVNEVFATALAGGEFDGFRRHTTEAAAAHGPALGVLPIVARAPRESPARAGAADVWRDSLSTPRHEPEQVLREQEARQVAEAIAGLVRDEGFAPAQIMVLSRKRESLRLAAAALRAVHVRAENVEEAPLLDAPEARDLLAVLDALASPGHRLSLAQALRSPLFGASDADLVTLAQRAAADGDWWSALVDGPHDSPALQRAASLLRRWQADAQRLPPHDLLDRVVAQGEFRERVAAAVPAAQRVAALAAIDAMLAQALLLDGGRYATPYTFVRTLKRRNVSAPAVVSGDAVRLLTVHGAKGLEARAVFVMDADPEPRNPDTATLLIDWPVEAARPNGCAFVYAESRCPPSLQGLLASEVAARQREELNGLYVAMTRAEQRLVFSATAPSRPSASRSWWQRIEALPVPMRQAHSANAVAPGEVSPAGDGRTVQLLQLPRRVADASSTVLASSVAEPPSEAGADAASRLGQAVHRVLEWATGAAVPAPELALLAEAAARDFAASAVEVERLAAGILYSAQAARFFGGPGLRWAGNEVAVTDAGEALRIDRLVQLDGDDGPQWWVLDYKLQHAPQELPANREQLLRYRRAVQALQPGEVVHCAFVTGAGEVVKLE